MVRRILFSLQFFFPTCFANSRHRHRIPRPQIDLCDSLRGGWAARFHGLILHINRVARSAIRVAHARANGLNPIAACSQFLRTAASFRRASARIGCCPATVLFSVVEKTPVCGV